MTEVLTSGVVLLLLGRRLPRGSSQWKSRRTTSLGTRQIGVGAADDREEEWSGVEYSTLLYFTLLVQNEPVRQHNRIASYHNDARFAIVLHSTPVSRAVRK